MPSPSRSRLDRQHSVYDRTWHVDFGGRQTTSMRNGPAGAAVETAMRYVFLVYRDEACGDGLEPCRRDVMAGEAAVYREELRDAGQLLAAAALNVAALTVRAPNGALEIVDGHGARASERLAAVWLTEARDLNEAIRLASRMPEARFGSIEVRSLVHEESER